MCNAPSIPYGRESVEDPAVQMRKLGSIGMGQLVLRGQRQLKLPSRSQFNSIAGVAIGPPKDISRQT